MHNTPEESSITDEAIRIARRVDAASSTSKKKNKRKRLRPPENMTKGEETTLQCPSSMQGKKMRSETLVPSANAKDDIEYPYPVDSDDHCETPSEA